MARSNHTHRSHASAQPFTQRRPESSEFVRLFDYVMLLLCVTALLSALSRDHYLPSIGTSTADHPQVVDTVQQMHAAPNH